MVDLSETELSGPEHVCVTSRASETQRAADLSTFFWHRETCGLQTSTRIMIQGIALYVGDLSMDIVHKLSNSRLKFLLFLESHSFCVCIRYFLVMGRNCVLAKWIRKSIMNSSLLDSVLSWVHNLEWKICIKSLFEKAWTLHRLQLFWTTWQGMILYQFPAGSPT